MSVKDEGKSSFLYSPDSQSIWYNRCVKQQLLQSSSPLVSLSSLQISADTNVASWIEVIDCHSFASFVKAASQKFDNIYAHCDPRGEMAAGHFFPLS